MPISSSNMEKQVILRVNTEDANVTPSEDDTYIYTK